MRSIRKQRQCVAHVSRTFYIEQCGGGGSWDTDILRGRMLKDVAVSKRTGVRPQRDEISGADASHARGNGFRAVSCLLSEQGKVTADQQQAGTDSDATSNHKSSL